MSELVAVTGGNILDGNGYVDIAFLGAFAAPGPVPGAGLLGLVLLILAGLMTKVRGFLAR